MDFNTRFTLIIGAFLILLGGLFILAPIITRYIGLEDIPSWLLYVYKRESFYFVTSPILILVFLAVLLWRLLIQ